LYPQSESETPKRDKETVSRDENKLKGGIQKNASMPWLFLGFSHGVIA
jgi:hypothetical protein